MHQTQLGVVFRVIRSNTDRLAEVLRCEGEPPDVGVDRATIVIRGTKVWVDLQSLTE